MLIFGGLVHENVRNDLWSMDVRDCSTMPVKTKGDAPIARVGHAAAIADRIMIVWGGDTKVKQEDPQDEGLYILDLRECPDRISGREIDNEVPKSGLNCPWLLDRLVVTGTL
jgi:hypothetical protein